MTQLYYISITGKLLNNVEMDQAVENFARRFKLPLEKAQQMIQKAPVILKKGLDEDSALKYQQASKSVGLDCQISKEASQASNSSESLTTSQIISDGKALGEQHDSNQCPKSMPEHQFRYAGKPDYGFVTIDLPANDTIKVEASSMATMDTNIRMKTKLKGGLGRFITGESLFINEFTAENGPGEIGIAPATPGDITHQYLNGNTLFLQNSAFVACSMGVNTETKWQGFTKGFFSGENFFLIKCSGQGDLWFNTYGALIEIDIKDEYVVDTGNIVAFSEGLDYQITKVGGYKSLFFSGEGFVCRFKGRGKLWMQTRGTDAFVNWCQSFRRVESSS